MQKLIFRLCKKPKRRDFILFSRAAELGEHIQGDYLFIYLCSSPG